jgi:aspartate/tyrosine/aromatic aminotransferase
MLEKNLDKEYAGITGIPSFTKSAGALAYGENSPAITGDRVSEKKKTRQTACMLNIHYSSPLLNLSPVLVLFVLVVNF